MSIEVKQLEEIYLRVLSNADISNPNVLDIVNDLRERIKKASALPKNPVVKGNVTPTDQLTATLIRGDGRTLETKKIPFPASRPVAPTYKEETTQRATKDSWVQEKPQKELFLNEATPESKPKRNNANRHTGPKYTKENVQKALDKYYSPWEAGESLGMTDPNYIYQLIKKYGIKRNVKSLWDKK